MQLDLSVREGMLDALEDAIGLAGDQGEITWIAVNGQRIAAIVPVKATEHAKVAADAPPGTPVRVYSPDSGIPLFNGYLIPGAPWQFWNRVTIDGPHLDLPPAYRIEAR